MIGPASRQAAASGEPPHGPRARMRKILLDAAHRLMAQGITPSVAELAEHAQVSRATAYRYFPSQSALIAAVVDESLGPILAWDSKAADAAARVDELLRFAYPRLEAHEAPLRAAIQVSLQQHAEASAGRAGNEPRLVRGHRVDILKRAIAPLAGTLTPAQQDRVAQALSLVYGTEVFLVLKDIWRLDLPEVTEVARWTANAIIQQALAEAGETPRGAADKAPAARKR
ncbi:TetR family transcriptional regulator [Achromobacter sp. NCFB-sbj8-Ac1-l]|uniref:TetR family transcriptional regulator n=1 Tax=unclassified Achromobacter TaxID=2626865 RepID=UPI004046F285